MRKDYILILLVFVLPLCLFGQREAANWYFGDNAGLNFNQGFPIPLLDGQLDTVEGCESISTEEGQLLFYTDGKTVWNRLHQVMNNGEDLLGSFSSSQSALIIPKIDDENIYYVFTADVVQAYEEGGGGNGLNYSVVDMSLDGGLGDVTLKNINMLPQGSEKITAVSAYDGTGYWLITHFQNRFYAYKVGQNGVSSSPVISTIGPTINDYNNIRGSIKSSPDGSKIAIAHAIFEPEFSGLLMLYDFDTGSGQLSNELLIGDELVYYGVEFSSNSSKLYTSGKVVNEDLGLTSNIRIYQYDLEASNIQASQFMVQDYPNLFLSDLAGTLQIGIDKKIYHSVPGNALSVIRTPNLSGLDSDFRAFDIDLGGRATKFGLPPFIQSFFESIVSIENFCVGSSTEFSLESDEEIASIIWDFGDPASGAANISNELSPSHTYTSPGIYTVTIDVDFLNRPPKSYVEFVEISPIPESLPNISLVQCDVDGLDDGISRFNLTEAEAMFNLGNADLTANYFETLEDAVANENGLQEIGYQNLFNNQVIYARVFENSECFAITEISLVVQPMSDLETYGTFDICSSVIALAILIEIDQITSPLAVDFPDRDILLYRTEDDALFELNEVTEDLFIPANEPLEMYFRIEMDNACDFIGRVDLNVLPKPDIENQNVDFCEVGTVLDAGSEFTSFLWSTGETTQTITVYEPGTYTVEVGFGGACTNDIIINVNETTGFDITEVIIRDFQANNTITILTNSSGGSMEYSLDGENFGPSNIFRNVQPGLYEVYARKNNCYLESEIVLVGGYPKFFTPNGDGINDTWQMKQPEFFELARIEIYDRYGKLLKTMNSATEGWNGYFNGELMRPSDYWFVMYFNDRTVRGHFTLKL